MVIARTDLDIPAFLLVPGTRPRRRALRGNALQGSGRFRHRLGTLSRRAAAAVTGVFSRPASGGSTAVRHQPTRRPDFIEGAAMGREMFRL